MSSTISYEFVLCCPHNDCKFKRKKYNSIQAVNMHFTKIHNKLQKLKITRDTNGVFRFVLRMK